MEEDSQAYVVKVILNEEDEHASVDGRLTRRRG